jgi:hypothetical protein
MNLSITINKTEKSEQVELNMYGVFLIKLLQEQGINQYKEISIDLQKRISEEAYNKLMETVKKI